MRKLLLSMVAFSALAVPARAADLPSSKSAPVFTQTPPVFSWSGLYVGATIGGGWSHDHLRYDQTVYPTQFSKLTGAGVAGGGLVGYNFLVGENILLGLEADIDGTSLDPKSSTYYQNNAPIPIAGEVDAALRWQGSLRGRIGYAFGSALLYATGGLAFAQVDRRYYDTQDIPYPYVSTYNGLFSNVRAGWTVGGGLEYHLLGAWRARVEYRYVNISGVTDNISVASSGYYTGFNNHSIDENIVKVGLIYAFGENNAGPR